MARAATTPNEEEQARPQEIDRQAIVQILAGHSEDRGDLITILEDIQAKYNYLPEAALRMVADQTGRSLVDIYGIATFYGSFSLAPRGEHLVCACLGTACHVRGAPRVVEELQRQLGIEEGQTTPDMEFTLETVNCLGACALGPVVVIDGHYFSKVRKSTVRHLLSEALAGFDKTEAGKEGRTFPIQVSCPRCNHSLMDHTVAIDGHPSIRVAISFDHERGWLRLSSLYGSRNVLSEHKIPADRTMTFFCPHCHGEIGGQPECEACGAPMVPMTICCARGTVLICSRRGCGGRVLDLV